MSAKVFLLFFGLLSGIYAMAQDDGSSTHTESNTAVSHTQSAAAPAMWYTNPIVWVVGGAILLIVIILAVRSNSSSTTVVRDGGPTRTTTTTVRED